MGFSIKIQKTHFRVLGNPSGEIRMSICCSKSFQRLMKWPKIPTNDLVALREFVDFLQGYIEAISHIKGRKW